MSAAAIVEAEPLLMSGPDPKLKNSPHADREARARALAVAWGGTIKDFVLAHYAEIVQVREDFLNKAKSKTICGCNLWEDYVTQVLHCSPQHMRRLLHGDNPATEIHDGSANRQPKPEEMVEDDVEQTEEMTAEEYAEALIQVRLEKLALAVSRKALTDHIPGKFFVYGSGGMDKRNGKLLREKTEQDIKDNVPNIYTLISKVAQRLLAARPARPERLLTCPSCRNQDVDTIKPFHTTKDGIPRFHCTKCGCKRNARYFMHLPRMQPNTGENPVRPEPNNPKSRARKKETSPRGMVNVDELPPEVREKVMAQIEQAGVI